MAHVALQIPKISGHGSFCRCLGTETLRALQVKCILGAGMLRRGQGVLYLLLSQWEDFDLSWFICLALMTSSNFLYLGGWRTEILYRKYIGLGVFGDPALVLMLSI